MAKLLTEEEYNALVADRERLDFLSGRRNEWLPVVSGGGSLAWDTKHGVTTTTKWASEKAYTLREAIDKARGAKCSN